MHGSKLWPILILGGTVLVLVILMSVDRARRKAGKAVREPVRFSQFQDRGEISDPARRATTSMITGIVGLVLASLLAVFALCNGISAKRELGGSDRSRESHAMAGIALGISDIAWGIAQFVLILVLYPR